MKKIIFLFLVVFNLFFSSVSFAFDPKVAELSQKKLPLLNEPHIDIQTLPNGIKVYYKQDPELPILKMSAFYEFGSIYETKEQRGLTGFFMSALRGAGSKKYSAAQIDEKLEYLAASISADSDEELSSLQLKCLAKDMPEVLDIFFSFLKEPAFEADRLDSIHKRNLDAIKQRNENPMSIAVREFQQGLYGQESPHAWLSTPATISAINRDVLQKFYDDNIKGRAMTIVASSQMDVDDFLKTITPYLPQDVKAFPRKEYPTHIEKKWEPSAEFIQKEGNQSSIVLGHFAEKRFNKDKYALTLANHILGGGTFGSKLGNRIRTDLGLAYGISSDFDFGTDYAAFDIVVQTKSESTVRTLQEIETILKKMVVDKNFTEEELQLSKEKILNQLVFQYESPYAVAMMRMTYDYYGYPPNYIAIFQKGINDVTVDDIKRVIDQYIFPDRLKIVIVGNQKRIPDLNLIPGVKELPLDDE